MGGHAIWALAGIRYNQRDYVSVGEIINVSRPTGSSTKSNGVSVLKRRKKGETEKIRLHVRLHVDSCCKT